MCLVFPVPFRGRVNQPFSLVSERIAIRKFRSEIFVIGSAFYVYVYMMHSLFCCSSLIRFKMIRREKLGNDRWFGSKTRIFWAFSCDFLHRLKHYSVELRSIIVARFRLKRYFLLRHLYAEPIKLVNILVICDICLKFKYFVHHLMVSFVFLLIPLLFLLAVVWLLYMNSGSSTCFYPFIYV